MNDNILISAWEVVLESQTSSGEVTATANEEAPVETGSCHTENPHKENEDDTGPEVKSAVKELVANENRTMGKKALNGVLCKMLHEAQSDLLSVVYNFLEQVILYLLRRDVIVETLDALFANVFDTYETGEK